jgi:YD repeat-containing protein
VNFSDAFRARGFVRAFQRLIFSGIEAKRRAAFAPSWIGWAPFDERNDSREHPNVLKFLATLLLGVVATSQITPTVAQTEFPAVQYVPGFVVLPCVRGSAEEACLIQDGTNPACPVNAKFGRPFIGVTEASIHWGCQPPPGYWNIGQAHNCLWQENDRVALNGVACLIGGCPANATLTNGNCVCNLGFQKAENSNTCVANLALAKSNGPCTDPSARGTSRVGNPCNPATGNKFEQQLVYSGLAGFELRLSFNSFDVSGQRFSTRWRDSFDRRISAVGTTAVVFRPHGQALRFTASGGAWGTDVDTADRLFELQNPPGTRTGWQFVTANGDELETYNVAGTLLAVQSRTGLTQTLNYSDGTGGPNGGFVLDANGNATTTVLPAGLLIRASDHFGRLLSFGYDNTSRITKLTDPAGGVYRFGYVGGNLASITFPDSFTRSYVYNEPAHTSGANLPDALTGIVDENGDRFATYKYDTQQRVITTEHAGGAMRHTLSYGAGSTTVTGPLGAVREYAFETLFDVAKTTGISGAVCPECGPASQGFDTNGNVASRVDWNGNRTNYTYDLARNLETSRTEGLTSTGGTTPQTRTITTQWHATFRLPTGIAEPLRITTFVYDPDGTVCGARGALCSKTVQATTDTNGSAGFSATPAGNPRTWIFTYNANGSVLSLNGPRTDVSDVMLYTYYPNDDPDLGKRGNVATIRNAANHLTSITAYNAHGQPLTVVDANGVTTTLTYDVRQRLKTRTVGTELTSYDYNNVGQLTKVTLPDGSFLSYGYDAAHRLTGIQDNLGNRIAYTLDAMGNRTLEEVRDPTNQLAQTRSRVISNLNRLFRELGAQSQTTEYGYDNQGNVLTVKDPLNRVTTNQYDALNRLKQVTSPPDSSVPPISAVTQYEYIGLDRLKSVSDPRSLQTTYSVDGLGNLVQQISPDTGPTVNTHDDAGNLLTQRDAKNQLTQYAYDALNRVTLITFHDGSKQAYGYDQGTNGIGRLTSITETNPANQATSATAYTYDVHGRVLMETRTLAGIQHAMGYRYDSFGRLDQLTYPSGRTVNYTFDALGRVSGITTTKSGGQPETVVSGVNYHPFGGVKGYTLGNGQAYARSIDQDGRIAAYTLGTQSFDIGYDAASRIRSINQTGNPTNNRTYDYDNLDRLTLAQVPGIEYTYGYDLVGNRLSRLAGSSVHTYAYSPASNQIASITPSSGPVRNFVFDPNGSTTADGINTYGYDVRGRMVQAASSIGITDYQVNALGQRIRKTNTLGDTVFHYDKQGRLIAETDPAGALKRELIYLGDIPVGVVQ